MIVKIQTPRYGGPQYLVYNEDRTYTDMIAVGEEPDLDEAMGGQMKRFFKAEILPNGVIPIDANEESAVPDPGW